MHQFDHQAIDNRKTVSNTAALYIAENLVSDFFCSRLAA